LIPFIAKQYFIGQIVSILKYLRSESIVHRDIKPANLLLNEKWQVVMADFGTAKEMETSELTNEVFKVRKIQTELNLKKVKLI
jgi:serine/threonine protein kinase